MGRRLRTQISLLAAVLLGAALVSSAARPDDAPPAKPNAEAARDASQMKAGERIGPTARSDYKRVPYAAACTDFYPLESQRLGEQGTATIGYAIAAGGTLQDVTLLKSSGFERLDKALLDCAATWHVPPVLKDGAAVLSPGHQATIRFQLSMPLPPDLIAKIAARPHAPWAGDPSVTPSEGVASTHNCLTYYPDAARRALESGEVRIGYDVGADGAIFNVTVLKSSGFADLDEAARTCVATVFRNLPALKDGQPVASTGLQSVITFSVR